MAKKSKKKSAKKKTSAREPLKARAAAAARQPGVTGKGHWTAKDGGVKLFLWNKHVGNPAKAKGTILFIHGSSMASQPTFDLQVPGRTDSSAMEYFAARGRRGRGPDAIPGGGPSPPPSDNQRSLKR